jgi:hypothetical protein
MSLPIPNQPLKVNVSPTTGEASAILGSLPSDDPSRQNNGAGPDYLDMARDPLATAGDDTFGNGVKPEGVMKDTKGARK